MTMRKKEYWEMNAKELAAATKEFDRPGVAKTFRPMTPAVEGAWRVVFRWCFGCFGVSVSVQFSGASRSKTN